MKIPISWVHPPISDDNCGFNFMVEIHVGVFEDTEVPLNFMSKYNSIHSEMENLGGFRSVWYPNNKKLQIVFGPDESMFWAY